MRRCAIVLVALGSSALVGTPAPARAQAPQAEAQAEATDDTTWTLQLDGGAEYDSNIHRLEVRDEDDVETEGAPLARLGLRHRLGWRRVRTERLSLSSFGGLKLFSGDSGQSENVAIVSLDGGYDWNLRDRGALVGLHATYYDAIPYELYEPIGPTYEGRTFRTVAAEASAGLLADDGHRVTGLVGYRNFEYKPDPIFDWGGEHYALLYQTTWWRGDPDQDDDAASVELSAGYRVERRQYDSNARTSSCADEETADPLCSAATTLPRADLNHSVAAELVYTGRRIYSARYELNVNDSNSYGESLVRQRFRLGFTSELVRDVFLTAEGTVLINVYLDPLVVARDEQARTFVSIDDENRNSLSLHLSRTVTPSWSVEGRYAIYSNEFTNEELSFRRQTVYFGAVYRTGQ